MSNYAPFEPLQESVKEKEQMKRKISLDNHKNIEQIVLKYNLKKLKSDYLDMNTYYIDSNGNISLSKDYIIMTPKPQESVINLIINNFTSSFSFITGGKK